MKRVAFVDSDGEVIRIIADLGYAPPEGDVVDGLTVKYIQATDQGSMADHEWMAKRVRRADNNSWQTVREKPNPLAKYSVSVGDWTWDHNDFKNLVRQERNLLLLSTDWTSANDNELTDAQKSEANAYRRSLRRVPNNLPDDIERLEDVVWPTKPDFL